MIGARATFCAAHRLPQHSEIHGHSYEVWAYTTRHDDAEEWQRLLKEVCKSLDHTFLAEDLSKMEQIAQRIGKTMGAKKIVVSRPLEGLCVEMDSF